MKRKRFTHLLPNVVTLVMWWYKFFERDCPVWTQDWSYHALENEGKLR